MFSRVRVNKRGDTLGEEAVASSNIQPGTIVVDEPPLLILPHQDVAPTTATGKLHKNNDNKNNNEREEGEKDEGGEKGEEGEDSRNKKKLLLSPAEQLLQHFSTSSTSSPSVSVEEGEKQEKEEAKKEYEQVLLGSLKRAEALATKFNLQPIGFFAPIIMAHYTMTVEEIKELVLWLVSHAEDPSQQQQASKKKFSSTITSLGSYLMNEKEIEAASQILENLEEILGNNNDNKNNDESSFPTSSFWKQLFSSSQKQQKQNQTEQRRSSAVSFLKWIHGVRINVHSDDVNKLTAVFKFACKFNHSCRPNTFWFLSSDSSTAISSSSSSSSSSSTEQDKEKEQEEEELQKQRREKQEEKDFQTNGKKVRLFHVRKFLRSLIGNAVHVATRTIKKDEATTFSYIGCGLNMLSPSPIRRQSMSHLHFVCACDRCRDFDEFKVQKNSNASSSSSHVPSPSSSEVLSRALVCSECFNNYQKHYQRDSQLYQQMLEQYQQLQKTAAASSSSSPPPPPPPPQQKSITEFLTVVQTSFSWKCHRCGNDPNYDQINESLLHETVNVDGIMGEFFLTSSSERNLTQLWATLARVSRQLSMKHYICIVGINSFVSHLNAQLKRRKRQQQQRGGGAGEELQKLCQLMSSLPSFSTPPVPSSTTTTKSSPSTVGADLISLVMTAAVWFNAFMKGTPQHIRFLVLICEICEQMLFLLSASSSSSFSSSSSSSSSASTCGSFLTKKEIETLKLIVSSAFKTEEDKKAFEKLRKYNDMKP